MTNFKASNRATVSQCSAGPDNPSTKGSGPHRGSCARPKGPWQAFSLRDFGLMGPPKRNCILTFTLQHTNQFLMDPRSDGTLVQEIEKKIFMTMEQEVISFF